MNRALSAILFLGLFVAAVTVGLWLNRRYRAKGSIVDAKVGYALTALSFIFVGAGLVAATMLPPAHTGRAGGKALPPEVFATIPPAIFGCAALLAAIGLLLGAAIELVATWRSPSGVARRQDAARLSIYGVGAFVVAIIHLALLRLVPDLLK
jgi:hypothetical protein